MVARCAAIALRSRSKTLMAPRDASTNVGASSPRRAGRRRRVAPARSRSLAGRRAKRAAEPASERPQVGFEGAAILRRDAFRFAHLLVLAEQLLERRVASVVEVGRRLADE